MKKNGELTLVSDIVKVGTYKFGAYKVISNVLNSTLAPWMGDVIVGKETEHQLPFSRDCAISPTDHTIVTDRNILNSLLSLSKQVLPFNDRQSKKHIIRWCDKYGLPFCDIQSTQITGYFSFPLVKFIDFLFELRDTFWKIESLYGGDDRIKSDACLIYGDNPYMKNPTDFISKEDRQRLISDFVNASNIKLELHYSGDVPKFCNSCADLVSLSRYQIAILLLSGSGCAPRRCKCCGSMFFASRKNQLYGSCCSRQKAFNAKKRKKEG